MEDLEAKKQDSFDMEELQLITFSGVRLFKSIRRAIRRGNVAPNGEVYPKKPYNCRKATPGRKMNEIKKRIHYELKHTI